MKENKLFIILLIIVAVAILAGHFMIHGGSMNGMQRANKSQSNEKIATNTVQIKGYAFTPQKIRIKKGTTITWENFDIAQHTVTVDDESKNGPKSKLFGKGEKFSFTFKEKGTYAYHCEPHPYMKATVEVTE